MKFLSILIVTISLTVICDAILKRKILAKEEGCVEEVCGTLCSYDDHKFFPGSNQTLYREVTCLQMTCTDDFHVIFEPCPHDGSGRCHFENYDRNLTWPDCCGIKVCM